MFAILAYNGTNAGAMTNQDLAAAADPEFTARNGHYTFTEQYKLLYDFITGAAITQGRYQVPTWNAIGVDAIPVVNVNAGGLPGSPPQLGRYIESPLPIPVNEEFQVQATGSGADTVNYGMVIGTPNWNRNLPQGQQPFVVRATAAIAAQASAWSGGAALTFSQSLRGGVYAVIGASCQMATYGVFFRLIFPRNKMYMGRRLRPGWLTNNAVGDLDAAPVQVNPYHLGVWGYFHTFEMPQLEVYGNSAHAATQVVYLRLVYLGEDIGLLTSAIAAQA